MFTGIIESIGRLKHFEIDRTNLKLQIESNISDALHVDQSVAHNGVCLTVTNVGSGFHEVTVVLESLRKSNFWQLEPGSLLNLERSLSMNDRLDGHIVQGHVDCTAGCLSVQDEQGSWRYTFDIPEDFVPLIVDKGSIAINGVSLTAIVNQSGQFEVAIIPYTYENTGFQQIKEGNIVNLEFDVIGKYVQNMMQPYLKK